MRPKFDLFNPTPELLGFSDQIDPGFKMLTGSSYHSQGVQM
jgi:hypothetical protein